MPHTLGPWEAFILDRPLSEIPAYVQECIESSPREKFHFVGCHKADGGYDVCHVGNGPDSAANALLIAAAPEMLEALKEAKANIVYRAAGDDWDTVSKIEDAIAKAEGRA